MRMNKDQLFEQLFWRWVNLCEQKWISLTGRHRVWAWSARVTGSGGRFGFTGRCQLKNRVCRSSQCASCSAWLGSVVLFIMITNLRNLNDITFDSQAAGATRVSPIRRTGDTPVADGGHEGVLRCPHHPPSRAPMKQLLQVVGEKRKRFLPVGAKTCFSGEAPRQQGRQECRPSDGPATLLSPIVATKACFAA
ncbi:MAG: hypothetical protein RL077_4205, partial [Verrucomicrobiota bacterium]